MNNGKVKRKEIFSLKDARDQRLVKTGIEPTKVWI